MPDEWQAYLTPVEKKIIAARQIGFSFSQLDECRVEIDRVIMSASSIFGCALPSTEYFAGFIADEVEIFIKEFGYGELTFQEVLLALRLNAKGGLKFPSGLEIEPVQFSGVTFNVDFLAKVLSNYLSVRNLLQRKLENFIDGHA